MLSHIIWFGWFAFGVATQLLFVYSVAVIFAFFWSATPDQAGSRWWLDLWCIDLPMAVQFAIVHSWLLHPRARNRLNRLIPAPVYGCVFASVTCLNLLLMFANWRSSDAILWDLSGPGRALVRVAYVASWVALAYSVWISGAGYQTGWTTFWPWIRRRDVPRREFRPRGMYQLLRHPVYMSFLGLIWFTPVMSMDRMVLATTWTGYIFVGSWLKDRRMEFYLGDTYRQYESIVPGYPAMLLGPLGKRRYDAPTEGSNGCRDHTISRRAA